MYVNYLMVGLGNPGKRYRMTRHNLGFMVVDFIAQQKQCVFQKHREYLSAEFFSDQKRIVLLKPTTCMNLSGLAVAHGMKKYNTVLSNILILSDDFNLPLGKMRIRPKGTAGGHKGLASIIDQVKSDHFPRLRMGIQSESEITDAVTFVLSPFNETEKEKLVGIVNKAAQIVLEFINAGIDAAMNNFN